jgi:hypothetical protein
VLEDLEARKVKLGERLASLRAESEEIWKSLEAAEKTLLEMVNCADYDTTRLVVMMPQSLHLKKKITINSWKLFVAR